MTTVITIIILAALLLTLVLSPLQEKRILKRCDEQNDIQCMMKDELKKHNELMNKLIDELHRANRIALLQHVIDDWDKEKWKKVLEEYSSLYFIDKYFSEHKETESSN